MFMDPPTLSTGSATTQLSRLSHLLAVMLLENTFTTGLSHLASESRPIWEQRITSSLCLMVSTSASKKLMIANKNLALNAVAGAAFGAAGQR